MPLQSWVETVIAAQGDGTAVTNSTTETSLLPTHARIFTPSNLFGFVGQSFEVLAMGRASTVVTTPGTLTLRLKVGGTGAGGVAVLTTGAIALTTTAQTNDTWSLRAHGTVRAVGGGTSANVMSWGQFTSGILNNSTTAPADWLFPQTAPAVSAGFDSSASNQIDLTAQWSVANAANSIQLHGFLLKSLN
jgi:hypothetical protein